MRPAVRGPARLPLRHQLLPDRDALPALRRRGRLSLPDRGGAAIVRQLRACRDVVFIVLLFVAFAYVWRRGALEWSESASRCAMRRGGPAARGATRGEQPYLEGEDLERHVEERIMTTTLEHAVAWARSNSFFPRYLRARVLRDRDDVDRRRSRGRRALRLRGLSGFAAASRSTHPLGARVDQDGADRAWFYDQMLEPKWAISMGACCSSMGVFNNYALVPAGQVHADRRPRPRLPAAAGGTHARHPEAARDGPGATPRPAGASAMARRHRGAARARRGRR